MLHSTLAAAFNTGDLATVMNMYDVTGTIVPEPGKPLSGRNGFEEAIKAILSIKESLTSIAYECGYFDQSHFIRDFKAITGITPSDYQLNKFPVNQVFLQ